MTSVKIIALIIVSYLLIGDILWNLGLKFFGGIESYKKYLKDRDENVPIWFIFAVFILFWPFFLRRK